MRFNLFEKGKESSCNPIIKGEGKSRTAGRASGDKDSGSEHGAGVSGSAIHDARHVVEGVFELNEAELEVGDQVVVERVAFERGVERLRCVAFREGVQVQPLGLRRQLTKRASGVRRKIDAYADAVEDVEGVASRQSKMAVTLEEGFFVVGESELQRARVLAGDVIESRDVAVELTGARGIVDLIDCK